MPGRHISWTRMTDAKTKNIGASIDVFVNLLHEDLSFLFANSHDRGSWNYNNMVAQYYRLRMADRH